MKGYTEMTPTQTAASRAHKWAQYWSWLTPSLLTLFTVSGLALGCADDIAIEDSSMGPMETVSNCPAEYYNPDTGLCMVNQDAINAYNQLMQQNGQVSESEVATIDSSDLENDQRTRLAQEGTGKFYIYTNETKRIGVRVINYVGAPVPQMEVSYSFSMEGTSDPLNTMMSAQTAFSDQFGVASIQLTGSSTPTYFRLNMETSEGDTLSYGISVIQPLFGEDGSTIEQLPPGQRCNVHDIQGTYDVENHYELARFLGDGVFNTLQTINRALTDPGGLIGDWIRDRIGGIVGDAVRGIVREVINNLLRGLNMPQWAQLVTNIITDVTTILTDLEIKSNIRLGGASGPNCEVSGIHTWEELVVVWQGSNCPGGIGGNNTGNNSGNNSGNNTGNNLGNNNTPCGQHRVNLTEVGVSVSETQFEGHVENQNALSVDLVIEEHQLDLNVGVVLITLLQTVILPQRANVRSVGELVAQIMPCDQFGQLAASLVGFIPFFSGSIANFASNACRDGVEALGNDLTRRLLSNLEVDTFKVKGRCKLRSNDTDPKTELMYEGRWEEGQGAFLQGNFNGTLRE